MKSVAGPAAPSHDPISNPDTGRVLAKRLSLTVPHARRESPEPTVRSIYEEYARFVWLTLQRFGVERADLDDLAHDVFVVVHRRLRSFDGTSRMTTWLFGICMRLAANYRRRRRNVPSAAAIRARVNDDATVQVTADEILVRREEKALAQRVLAELSLEKRAVFTMFEIEALSGQEIAELMGVPIGTVYSRLHEARKQIERILSRTVAEKESRGRK
jgi:RNA polymerase sigma-70 factor (ECF subfamily)